jgi:hypothetical protein
MPVATLYDLADRVQREIPRCPRPVILDALRDAWHRFCSESEAYRLTVHVPLESGRTGYVLNPGVEADVRRISDAVWRSSEDVAAGAPGTRIPMKRVELFRIDGKPHVELDLPSNGLGGTDGKLYLTLVLVPILYAEDQPSVPEDLLARYGDAIAARAVADLAGQRGEPWYNPDRQLLALNIYNHGKNQARKQYAPAGGIFQ